MIGELGLIPLLKGEASRIHVGIIMTKGDTTEMRRMEQPKQTKKKKMERNKKEQKKEKKALSLGKTIPLKKATALDEAIPSKEAFAAKVQKTEADLDVLFAGLSQKKGTNVSGGSSQKNPQSISSGAVEKRPRMTVKTTTHKAKATESLLDVACMGKETFQRRRTPDGLPIYTEEELVSSTGGDTPLCPFDCECCY